MAVKRKTNFDVLIEKYRHNDNLHILWKELNKAKFPIYLRPALILGLELYLLMEFFENNQKLFTVFGVFGALTIYANSITPKASYFSFLLFLTIAILLWLKMILSKSSVFVTLVGSVLMYGLISEIYSYINLKYSEYLFQLNRLGLFVVVTLGVFSILIWIYYSRKSRSN